MMAAFIGIDLGTTFSAVATIDETGRPVIVHNDDGENITPSCVAIDSGETLIGEDARRHWGSDPENAAARFKRRMGSSEKDGVSKLELTPTELSSLVLKKLKKMTEEAIGPVGEAVVTIPANFSNEAREATLAAAKAAGLNIKNIINEPTAAALYYAFKSDGDLHGTYAVYDMGGGTFDVSIIRIDGQNVEVLASNGVSRLGGDDFDQALARLVGQKYKDAAGEDLDAEDFTINDAEEEKKSLSKRDRVRPKVNKTLIELHKDEFEEAISTLVSQAEMLCESTIDEADIEPSDIKAVFLAGGSTRIPMVQQSVKRVFEQDPVASVNVDEVVALGAALYAAYKGDRSNLSDVQQNSISKIKVSEVTGKCFGTISVIHDETRDQIKLHNSILIKKNEKIPCSVTKSFYTMHDGQDAVDCQITESTSEETDPQFVKEVWKGELKLPSGRPEGQEIKITYSFTDNQTMQCSFEDVATGRKTEVDVNVGAHDQVDEEKIEQFMVE